MTANARRQAATLLVGAMAMLTALLVVTLVRQDRCLDAGGRWIAATRTCESLPDGAAPLSSGWAWGLGLVAGVVTAVVLWRAFDFFAARAASRADTPA